MLSKEKRNFGQNVRDWWEDLKVKVCERCGRSRVSFVLIRIYHVLIY